MGKVVETQSSSRSIGSGWLERVVGACSRPKPIKTNVYLGPKRRPNNKSIHKILTCEKLLSLVFFFYYSLMHSLTLIDNTPIDLAGVWGFW